MNFIENMEKDLNQKRTENGALALESTTSKVLDLFALGGAMRGRTESDITRLFSEAYAENKLQALKVAFHLRDITEGQGERRFGRLILKYLGNHDAIAMSKNIALIPHFGRWDDLYALVGTKLEKDMFKFIKTQLIADLKSEHPSLLAKWLKSENASSFETKKLAKRTRLALGMSSKCYRNTLSKLRKRIDLLETKITQGDYDAIDYSTIPSQAGLKYRSAFYNHDEERYTKFVTKIVETPKELLVEKNVKTFKAKTLYPYQIVEKARLNRLAHNEIQELEAYWRSLPDYLDGKEVNALVIVDTSGSMNRGSNKVAPIDVAISLGVYLAERNTGEFKDYFMTFSRSPQLQKVMGQDIVDKVRNLNKANWDMNTNLEKALDKVLEVAVKGNLVQSELPAKLIVVSDMEFDQCVYNNNEPTFLENIRTNFALHGYTMPSIVFWNVDARNNTIHAAKNDRNVQLVSGMSANTFVNLIKSVAITPYDLMLEVINSERYSVVTI